MQIKKLKMHNFKQYKDVEISFTEGLTGFIGKNGAGKSTIFDAIHLALYGKFSSNKELCKNDLASDKDNFSVALIFEDKGKAYKVTRDYRGKSLSAKAELFEDHNLIASGASEVNKSINRILKMDAKNFENSFFSKQKDVTSLLTLPANERQFQLRKMLGLSKLDKLEDKVKLQISDIRAQLKGKQDELLSTDKIQQIRKEIIDLIKEEKQIGRNMNHAKEVFDKVESEYTEIKAQLKQLERTKEEYDNLVKKNDLNENNLKNINAQIEKNRLELKTLGEKKKRLDGIIGKKDQYSRVNEEVELLLELKSQLEKKLGVERTIKELERRISVKSKDLNSKVAGLKEFEGIEEKIKSKNMQLDFAEKDLESQTIIKEEIASTLKMVSELISEKEARVKSIKGLGKDSPCPECERPLREQYDNLLLKYKSELEGFNLTRDTKNKQKDEAEKSISKKKRDISDLREQLNSLAKSSAEKESLSDRITELKDELNDYEISLSKEKNNLSSLGKVDFDAELLKTKQEERAELKKTYDEIMELETMMKKVPEINKELIQNELQRGSIAGDIELKKREIIGLKFDRGEYDKIRMEREKKEELVNTTREKLTEIKSRASEVSNNKKIKKNELENDKKLRLKIEVIECEKITYEKLLTFLRNFKVKITSHELPAISTEASRLFSNITKGRYLNLRIDEDFNFRVIRDEKDVELETLSGGEKDLASLCLRLAISKRISALAGRKNMGFLALDEVFGSQDEDRREELINSLSEISRDFRQIFVISHNQDVQEAFSNRLLIQKNGNFSSVSFSSN